MFGLRTSENRLPKIFGHQLYVLNFTAMSGVSVKEFCVHRKLMDGAVTEVSVFSMSMETGTVSFIPYF